MVNGFIGAKTCCVQMEDEHNKIGESLTLEVLKELGDEYKVRFPPSSFAKNYVDFNF